MTTTIGSFEFDGDGTAEYRELAAQAIHAAVMAKASAQYLTKDAEQRSAKADAPDATEKDRERYAVTLAAARQAVITADEAYAYSVFAHEAFVNAMAAEIASQFAGVVFVEVEEPDEDN